ncbi:hypothetical protein [Paenibacillus gansuensis]|uniref:DUF3918 domain-containing protein n=1 Tax=Paenibacillus gansuensis TaxID=306542 RepID=A0ABW5PCP7_9BACL
MLSKRSMFTAIGLGAAYLLRNKQSRDKLMGQISSMTGKTKPNNTQNY